MGGNALSAHKPIRLNREDYFLLTDRVIQTLRTFYPAGRFSLIPAYKRKESFGDADILVSFDREVEYNPFALADDLGSVETVRNGSSTSLGVRVRDDIPFTDNNIFQVDLIYSPPEEHDYALRYFSFNDRGNLVGKLAHKLGLKHGHRGLVLPVRLSNDHLLGEVVLTQDPRQAEAFLGVEYVEDFDTLEQVFENVIKSRLFSKEIYAYENMNNVARVRDRKRTTYRAFLEYIHNRDLPNFEFNPIKQAYLPEIFEEFPHAQEEYQQLIQEKQSLDAARMKFNGDLVKEWTGLTGKELGKLMKKLKHLLPSEKVANMTDNQVKEFVMQMVKELT